MKDYTKPVVFNVIEAMKRIDDLEAQIEELKKDRTNLEIKCRILEERLSRYE